MAGKGKGRILVTGARGFIGGFLCQRLLREGCEVIALATTETGTERLREAGMEVRVGDLTRRETIKGLCDGVETVFHLAARVTYWGTRRMFYDTILGATANLLEEGERAGVSRFLYVSSFCAAGAGGVARHLRGHREEDPEAKTGTYYGDAKYEAERLVLRYHEEGRLGATILRPSNVIGPGSVWVVDMLELMRAGGRVPLVDGGRHSASLLYVENLVDGLWLALESEAAGGRTYHFRDDYRVTWRRYLADQAALAGEEPRFVSIPFPLAWGLASLSDRLFRPLGIRTRMTRHVVGLTGRDNDVDTTRAREELGWRTRVPYEEAMETIGEWVAKVHRQGRGS